MAMTATAIPNQRVTNVRLVIVTVDPDRTLRPPTADFSRKARIALTALLKSVHTIAGCNGSPSSPSGCCAPPGGGALAITFTPQDATFAAAAAEYRQLWADEGPRGSGAFTRTHGRINNRLFWTMCDSCRARVRSSQPIHRSRAAIRQAELEHWTHPTTWRRGVDAYTRSRS